MWFYLLGLKKWATEEREVDFDFDDVQLRKCRTVEITEEVTMPPGDKHHPHYDHSADVCTYIVMRGDTLWSISQMYHTSVQTLVAMNNIQDPSLIFVMQPLQVPCGGGSPYVPLETWGTGYGQAPVVDDSTYASTPVKVDKPASASRDKADKPASASRGKADEPAVVVRVPAPDSAQAESSDYAPRSEATIESTGAAQIHVVQRGEFMGQIAQRYGTTVKELSNLNGISNPSLIRVGQTIKVSNGDL